MGYPLTEEVIFELKHATGLPALVQAAMPAIEATLYNAFRNYDWDKDHRERLAAIQRQREQMLKEFGRQFACVSRATMGIAG
jgi:hypothetical protein